MRILLFILIQISFLFSSAQRVNEHGLKMVSEVEWSYYAGENLIKFKYDENDRLIRMSVYNYGKLYRDFIKTSEGLTVKDYNIYNYSPLRWEISFDTYGNISNIAVFEEFEPGAIRRDTYNFFYERDKISNTFWLTKYSFTETSKRKGQTSWYGTTRGTSYNEMLYKDGFIRPLDHGELGKSYIIDYEHINDTNINLLRFFECMVNGGGNLSYFDITEWLPCRSKYFISKMWNLTRYDYKYDQNNNLIQIKEIEHWKNEDYCKRWITIKYVY